VAYKWTAQLGRCQTKTAIETVTDPGLMPLIGPVNSRRSIRLTEPALMPLTEPALIHLTGLDPLPQQVLVLIPLVGSGLLPQQVLMPLVLVLIPLVGSD
jgi:hypothetical protein